MEGQRIVDGLKRGRATAWAMIVRTKVFDEIILDTIAREKTDLVLNLAAGLDARPWRLQLHPTLRWVDVDLPEILRYKTEMLVDAKPSCRYEAVALDLRDAEKRQALFAQLGREATRVLVVAEGLLIYLSAEQVGTLAADLARQSNFGSWLIDLASPRLLALMQKYWGRTMTAGNASFQFAPAESTGFFERFGWREGQFRSAIEEARRLKREMPMMWLWRLIMPFMSKSRRDEARRMSGIVLLEHT
jgi:methyltransferase (TIGR00027 family)